MCTEKLKRNEIQNKNQKKKGKKQTKKKITKSTANINKNETMHTNKS